MSNVQTLHRPIPEFLASSEPKRLFIGGQWLPAVSGRESSSINPATGHVTATTANGGAEDIDLAVTAARTAFEGEWSHWTPVDRQRLLWRIHDLIGEHADELAMIETLDMGAPLSRARVQVDFGRQLLAFYASQTNVAGGGEVLSNSLPGTFVTTKLRAPVGVVGAIFAWNSPLMAQWWAIGPALATGCTTILKPSEDACLSVVRTAELLVEAGVPAGVVNIVQGRGSVAGAALAAHPGVDRIAFTGSTEVGRQVIEASAGNIKRVQLELGGKSPDLVFADANLDKAVAGAAMGVFGNTGQACTAGARIFVQRSIQDEFVARLAEFTGRLRVGNGLDPDIDLGPLANKKQLDVVLKYIDIGQEEGATLSAGGNRLGGDLKDGFFVEPTVFSNVSNDMRIAREEIFGPVISVIPFDDIEDGIRLANETPYGLAGGVWTQNLTTAHRVAERIKAGTIWVNSYNVLDPNVGFGGYKESGYGWKGGRAHVEGFLYEKAVYMKLED